MASAILASRNEPHWGESKVYMSRQNPNFTPSSSSVARKHQIYDLHHQPSTTQQQNHHHGGRFQNQMHSNNNFPPPDVNDNRNPNFVQDNQNNRRGVAVGFREPTKEDYVTFSISEYSRKERKDLKRRLISELERVRELSNRIQSQHSSSSRSGGGGGIGDSVSPNGGFLSMPAAAKKGGGGGGVKRPFPFASDAKQQQQQQRRPSMAETKVIGNMMKRCGTMLKTLMKRDKFYVFHQPVDPIALKLHDYNSVIRNPMDLGTVKKKFEKNVYKTPMEFASDVRLTFNNALLYNPKGHEVNVLAEDLLTKFNENFEPAYTKFENELKKLEETENRGGRNSSIVVPIGISEDDEGEREERTGFVRQRVLTPDRMRTVTPDRVMHKPAPFRGNSNPPQPSKQLPVPPQPPAPQPVIPPVYQQQQAVKQMSGGIGRPWSGKQPKPKAKDTIKREMSDVEKEKLGSDLQNLPADKMNQALQIIKKRDPTVCEEEDEIELDFEAMDTETLWELDRFVGNYKKMLTKLRRQSLSGGNGNQHHPAMEGNKSPMAVEMPEVKNRKAENECMEEDVDIGEDIPTSNFPPVEIEKDDAGYASDNKPGASSGSSSSDNDSSSDSDSDSGSSSESDSDGDEANKPNGGFD